MAIQIRRATTKDTGGIYEIMEYWHQKYDLDEKSNGYLYLEKQYTFADVARIVKRGYASVAVDGDVVVSIYFLNDFLETGNVWKRAELIKDKINKGQLPDGKYACSLLAATRVNYTGQGLNRATLHFLKDMLKEEYDYFVGIMEYQNEVTQKSSLKMGWKHYGDVGFGLLAIIGTTEENHNKLK